MVREFLIAVASLTVERGLYSTWASVLAAQGLSSCGVWAELPCGMRDLPGSRIEPMSPALVGGFLTTGPPEKSIFFFLCLPH